MLIEAKHSKLFFFILIAGFFLLLSLCIFFYSQKVFAAEENNPQQQSEQLTSYNQIIQDHKDSVVMQESLVAKAYVIYDINNDKIIRGQNANTPLPLASLTKVITVGTLLDTAKKNNTAIRDETKFRIQKALIQSSNDDADSLGYIYNYSFGHDLLVDANDLVKSIGVNDLTLTSLTGLDNYDGSASNSASAASMAKIFGYMYKNYREVFEFTKFDSLETDGGTITNTNQTTVSTFGILASKTGFTYAAGGNLGIIVSPEPGSAYAIIVMNSTKESRFTDMQKITKLLPLIIKDQQ